MMGISITKLLIILAIIIVVFGTKRLRHLGTDLGETIKGFRNSLKEGEQEGMATKAEDKTPPPTEKESKENPADTSKNKE